MKKVAKVIRIVSIPPVMVVSLILCLYVFKRELFRNLSDALITIFLLGIVPVLAYPLQLVSKKLRDGGRNVQRKLAFLLSLIGYTTAFIWAKLSHTTIGLKQLCSTYFFSVILLTIINMFNIRASGHSCSVTGVLVYFLRYFGIKVFLPIIIIYLLILWSSIVLKRHTIKDFVCGTLVCLTAFVISIYVI